MIELEEMVVTKDTFGIVKRPLVTIGIPTYNGGRGVEKALASICDQAYENVEVIISDNASTDNTEELCAALINTSSIPIKYLRQQTNIGVLANFEFLLQQANGTYFMWLADDDTLAPLVLGKYVSFLEDKVDYGLVSGGIEYSLNGKVVELERGFNFQQRLPSIRVIGYYFKVLHGAMYHGLMRTKLAKQVTTRKVIGCDWHFVANMAFLGKIKKLDFISYRKNFGGSSRTFVNYAKLIGGTSFEGRYPHLKIAMDAYMEVMCRSSVFSFTPIYNRIYISICSFLAVAISHYIKIYPFVIGGRVKRKLGRLFTSERYTYD